MSEKKQTKQKVRPQVLAFQLKCTKCSKVYMHTTKQMGLCPACRKAGQKPRPPKQKPSKPKPQHQPKPSAVTQIAEVATGMRSLRAVAKQQTHTSSGARRALSSASSRLMGGVLDSRTCEGAPPVTLAEDATSRPKLGYDFNSMFEILSLSTAPTAGVKLQLLPSPVYCMKVFAPDGIDSIVVIGAQMDPVSAFEGLIRGTKLGYAGQMIADTFQPSSDWYKYRAVSNSAVMEWSGPSLQVNGRAYVARTNDILGLSNFNPTDVADVVAFNAEEAISISCQHVSPTYEWAGVDANVDEESNPDAILADVTETFTWALGDFITPTVQASDYFTKKEVANLWNVTFTQGLALQQQKLGDAYFQWLDTVDKKWGLYKNPVDRSFSAGHVGIFRVYGHPADRKSVV